MPTRAVSRSSVLSCWISVPAGMFLAATATLSSGRSWIAHSDRDTAAIDRLRAVRGLKARKRVGERPGSHPAGSPTHLRACGQTFVSTYAARDVFAIRLLLTCRATVAMEWAHKFSAGAPVA